MDLAEKHPNFALESEVGNLKTELLKVQEQLEDLRLENQFKTQEISRIGQDAENWRLLYS